MAERGVIDRERIGFATTPTQATVDAWRVNLFCQAIGEADPVYTDPAAARDAGFRACPVPPTYLKAIEGEHFSSAQLLSLLGVPLRGVLHAEQEFDYLGQAYVGDVVTVSRTIADIHDKKEGELTFIVVDTDYSVRNEAVAKSRQTILVRNASSSV